MPGQGATSKAAFKVEGTTAWGTSTDCGAGDQIHFISESISHAIEQAGAIHKDGNVGAKSLYPIFKKYGGDLLVEGFYAGLERLLVVALGESHQDNSPVAVTTTTYEHYLWPSPDLSTRAFNGYEMQTPSGNAQRRGTLCFEKDTSVWELTSAMINAMNFEATPERITFTFSIAGKTLTFDSATNPNSSAWTLPSNTEQILWDDMTIYLKARDLFTISASNDNFVIDDGGGDVTLDIADGTYTGYELAQAIADACNAHVSVSGVYKCQYDEHLRKFRLFTTDGQTFSVSGASGSHDMGTTIGMTVDSTTAVETRSNRMAVPDSYAAFDSDDQIGVSKITFAHENNLDIESQDSESDLEILEPERNGFRRITGTIEIPRYKDDTWTKAANGSTTYELLISFTGSAIDSENYELKIHFPSIIITNADAPITGPELIKQTLAFEAQVPDIIDWSNFNFTSYQRLESQAEAANILTVGVGPDGIYVGETGGVISIWNPLDGSFTSSTDVVSNLRSLKAFSNKMFAGTAVGEIFVQTNGVWSLSTDLTSGNMITFEVFNNQLFCLVGDTGEVIYYPDGDTSWSSSTDTTSTDANDLQEYNGNLYMAGSDGATFTRVYEFDGATHLTGWTTSTDIGAGSSVQAMCVHDGLLYVSYGSVLLSFDGTNWETVDAAIGFSPVWMQSWKGQLMMLNSATNGDFYYYDFNSGAPVAIDATINISAPTIETKIINDKVFFPQNTTTFHMYEPIQDILITIQNRNATNPL